jgi:DNA-binding response OmpR family regulator
MSVETTSRSPGLHGRRVLIVEDECLIAWDLAESLQEHGARVVGPTTSVDAALKALDCEAAPDIALLDVSLDNHESVFAVADELRARRIPFVFYTGYRFRDVAGRFGDVIHCEKPMDGAELSAVLLAALASHASVRRRDRHRQYSQCPSP